MIASFREAIWSRGGVDFIGDRRDGVDADLPRLEDAEGHEYRFYSFLIAMGAGL